MWTIWWSSTSNRHDAVGCVRVSFCISYVQPEAFRDYHVLNFPRGDNITYVCLFGYRHSGDHTVAFVGVTWIWPSWQMLGENKHPQKKRQRVKHAGETETSKHCWTFTVVNWFKVLKVDYKLPQAMIKPFEWVNPNAQICAGPEYQLETSCKVSHRKTWIILNTRKGYIFFQGTFASMILPFGGIWIPSFWKSDLLKQHPAKKTYYQP